MNGELACDMQLEKTVWSRSEQKTCQDPVLQLKDLSVRSSSLHKSGFTETTHKTHKFFGMRLRKLEKRKSQKVNARAADLMAFKFNL